MKDVVRPYRVREAVRYLAAHSVLFRREQIHLIKNWDFLKDPQFSDELYQVVDENGNSVQVGNAVGGADDGRNDDGGDGVEDLVQDIVIA